MSFAPIDLTAVLGVLVGGAAVVIPLSAVFVRVALKPIVDSLANLRAATGPTNVALLERRIGLLERRLTELDGKPMQLASEQLRQLSES